jgi:hypothetical protein
MSNGALQPETIQQALYLHDSESLGAANIAARLGCPESPVQSLLKKLRPRELTRQSIQSQPARRRQVVDPLLGPSHNQKQVRCAPVRRERELTPKLKEAIVTLLRRHSIHDIANKFNIQRWSVRKISREEKMRFRKIGRGRTLAPEKVELVLNRIRTDPNARSIDLQKEFGISDWFVQKLRRSIGDIENRRFRRGWDEAKVTRALKEGMSISEIKRTCGIQHTVLWKLRKKLGDVEDRRRRGKPLPDETKTAILTEIKKGMSQRALSRKYYTHTDRIRELQIEIGNRPKRKASFTPKEVERIHTMFSAGMNNAEIGRAMKCTAGAIWLRRKKIADERRAA